MKRMSFILPLLLLVFWTSCSDCVKDCYKTNEECLKACPTDEDTKKCQTECTKYEKGTVEYNTCMVDCERKAKDCKDKCSDAYGACVKGCGEK